MVKYILVALILFMIIMILYTTIELRSGKKKSESYVSMFSMAYANKGVVDSLKDVISAYKPNSIEYLTINKAIYYLEHSIMRDYDTAFGYIEQTFGGENVLSLHEEIINKERRNIMLLLTKKD